MRSLPLYAQLDALQLVVDVYKHGKGRNLSELNARYPQHVVDPIKAAGYEARRTMLDHEWLTVTNHQFSALLAAIGDVWTAVPERLYYEVTE